MKRSKPHPYNGRVGQVLDLSSIVAGKIIIPVCVINFEGSSRIHEISPRFLTVI